MSWMAKLYETYEQAMSLELPEDQRPMPVGHTLQNAHIAITISGEGEFLRAEALQKMQVPLPATEKSAGRTGKAPPPHPLADKLQYVAADYPSYGGKKNSFFADYLDQLENWCNSGFSHPKALAVLAYVKKGVVIRDLLSENIAITDDNSCLITHRDQDSEKTAFIKSLPIDKGSFDQGAALVCWRVEIAGDAIIDTWKDESLQSCWTEYLASLGGKSGLCFVSGEQGNLASNHPAKLRHTGDKAKLISANDTAGFTFRGRFTDSKPSISAKGYQSVSVSFDVTQKAHIALAWLLNRQGFRNGDQAIVAWAVSGKPVPNAMDDSLSLVNAMLDAPVTNLTEGVGLEHGLDVGQSFAESLNKAMAGYKSKMQPTESITVMAIDSATPGRMGITYYREFMAHEFIETITCWHEHFAWPQRLSIETTVGKKKLRKTIWSAGVPAPRVIWDSVYGNMLTDTLKKNLTERLLPSIIEGRPVSYDIVSTALKRACNPNSMARWEWEQCVGVACSLYRGYRRRHHEKSKQRNFSMALEEENRSRDYLYGRLLAIAERIEFIALSVANEKRATTAERLMQRFSDRPYSTWRTIELALNPYIQRLRSNRAGFLVNRQKELDAIMSAFDSTEFTSDKPLSGEFLLGFHCQRLNLQNTPDTPKENSDES